MHKHGMELNHAIYMFNYSGFDKISSRLVKYFKVAFNCIEKILLSISKFRARFFLSF